MEILNLIQGSDEWIARRFDYFCASDAAAMMNDSPHMTRNQYLDLKKGWKPGPDSSFKEMLYEKGHEFEDSARKFTEAERFTDFPKIVGVIELDGLNLLASFDGIENGVAGCIPWEHKSWNKIIVENILNNDVHPMHFWQLEHQMLVNDCNELIFECSDGTLNNKESMIYKSVESRRKDLIAGWKRLKIDLCKHQLKAKTEIIVASKSFIMPVVDYKVEGTNIVTNIESYIDKLKHISKSEMSRVLESDQDFADKEQFNKDIKKARANLKEILLKVENCFDAYSKFNSCMNESDDILQKIQSHGEKQVKECKNKKKQDIIISARKNITIYLQECSKKIAPINIGIFSTQISDSDFINAMKNKRDISVLINAVDDVVCKYKIKMNEEIERAVKNASYLRDTGSGYEFLFNDQNSLLNKEYSIFKEIVDLRISGHKEKEKKRLELEREKIKEEEEEKVRLKIKEEQRLELEREKIREQEQARLKLIEEKKKKDNLALDEVFSNKAGEAQRFEEIPESERLEKNYSVKTVTVSGAIKPEHNGTFKVYDVNEIDNKEEKNKSTIRDATNVIKSDNDLIQESIDENNNEIRKLSSKMGQHKRRFEENGDEFSRFKYEIEEWAEKNGIKSEVLEGLYIILSKWGK